VAASYGSLALQVCTRSPAHAFGWSGVKVVLLHPADPPFHPRCMEGEGHIEEHVLLVETVLPGGWQECHWRRCLLFLDFRARRSVEEIGRSREERLEVDLLILGFYSRISNAKMITFEQCDWRQRGCTYTSTEYQEATSGSSTNKFEFITVCKG
jgi:hypothetical protein